MFLLLSVFPKTDASFMVISFGVGAFTLTLNFLFYAAKLLELSAPR